MNKFILLLGRICLSLIFVSSAVAKLFSWDQSLEYMTAGFSRFVQHMPMPDLLHQGLLFLGSHLLAILIVTTIFEGVGGLCILFGIKIRFGAILLILFLVPTTLVMHSFWFLKDQEKLLQMTMFMKNLSILGGLLILAVTSEEV